MAKSLINAVVIWSFYLMIFMVLIRDSMAQRPVEQEILQKILSNYDKRIRPTNRDNTSEPVAVTVNLYVRSLNIFDESKMECSVQLTFRLQWNDFRLQYNLPSEIDYLTLTDVGQIWIPDVFFTNEKESHNHEIMVPNHYLRIQPNGDILYSSRISLTLDSPMDMSQYPFDEQVCPLRLASYGYTDRDIKFYWKEESPVQVTSNLNLGLFSFQSYEVDDCDSTTNTGTYSCLKLAMKLHREFSYYLVHLYIPCCMLVIISWLPFWLDGINSITSRSIVGISALLVMTTQVSSFNKQLPPVSYTKAVDVWTGICLTFAFFSLIETIIVNYLARSEKSASNDNLPIDINGTADGANGGSAVENLPKKDGTLKGLTKNYMARFTVVSERIDGISRVVFPVIFVLFIFIYWMTY